MMALLDRIYRAVFCRGGHGVHSPFVFDLLTTVIEERKSYYCYERIHKVRLQILQRRDVVVHGYRKRTVKEIVEKYCFTELEHRLLFRLANRFRPQSMYVAGSDFGLTPLYLTAYATDSACIVVEPEPLSVSIAKEYIHRYTTASIALRDNFDEIPDVIDFAVWGSSMKDDSFTMQNFERFFRNMHAEGLMVIAEINASSVNRKVWKAICAHPKVTVTIDLYQLGIVFFNPKLHRRTYKSIVF